MSQNFYPLKVKNLIKESINAVSIVFEIPNELKEKFNYKAGQYLTLIAQINGQEVRRAYSLSSCPETDSDLKVSVKKVKDGLFSSYANDLLQIGDELKVMPPQGTFINNEESEHLVLFAAGSGITPIISILKSALHYGKQKVSLCYGNRSEAETMFKHELDALASAHSDKFSLEYFESDEADILDIAKMTSIVKTTSNDAHYFICGPQGVITAVNESLQAANISKSHIHIEYFASPKTDKKEVISVVSGDVLDVVMIIDDETYEVRLNENETLLEAGERVGIDPPFSCQSGVCTTCKAKLLVGEVEMENNFGLGDDEVEEGYILTCISTPKTPGVKISWDEV